MNADSAAGVLPNLKPNQPTVTDLGCESTSIRIIIAIYYYYSA